MPDPESSRATICIQMHAMCLSVRALQHVCGSNPRLIGQHASTMVQFVWQVDLHGVAQFVTNCLDAYDSPDPESSHAPD